MWQLNAGQRVLLDDICLAAQVEEEAIWVQETLTAVLDQYAKPVTVTLRLKRWWNRSVTEAREAYSHARRAWQAQHITTTDLQEARNDRNDSNRTVRRAKRTCWETFLAGPTYIPDHPREETARCWQALRLTKPKAVAITPTLNRPQREIAVSISEKEALVRETAFPPAPGNRETVEVLPGTWHKCVDETTVRRALFHQAVQKAPGIDRLNFRAVRLVWDWDSPRIVALARQCFWLGLHPQAWKTARGCLLRKVDKPDYTFVKAYRVISLPNSLGKVVEKIAAEALADHCETTGTLHPGQIRWVQSFLSGLLVQLVIDNTQCLAYRIDLGVP
jgi:hypothetical protein